MTECIDGLPERDTQESRRHTRATVPGVVYNTLCKLAVYPLREALRVAQDRRLL